jgi:hypothetical protein
MLVLRAPVFTHIERLLRLGANLRKRIFDWLILGGVAGALAGCASGKSYQEMASSIAPAPRTQGRIYFVRPADYVGAAIQPDIRLNDEVVGKSIPGGFFYVDRPPGDYKVSMFTEVENSVNFRLSAGETKYIEAHPSVGILI